MNYNNQIPADCQRQAPMSETWAGNYFLFALQTFNRSIIMTTQTLEKDLQWRVIGNWSAQADNGQPKSGAINYGFASQESALGYMANLLNIAYHNGFYTSVDYGKLDVSAEHWCKMRNFNASYRLAQYVTN